MTLQTTAKRMTPQTCDGAVPDPPPWFFVSVAYKGFNFGLSSLDAIVADGRVDVVFKGEVRGGCTPGVTESVRKSVRRLGLRAFLRVQCGDVCVVTSCKTLSLEGGTPSPGFL